MVKGKIQLPDFQRGWVWDHQLNDVPDDLAAKFTIHYYLDAHDALLKALAI